ncbi:MAG: hypothetical protein WC455_27840 [Dehalococcoidia bacterium]|jgi:hypothetical protein
MSNPHRIPRESLAVFRAAWEEEDEEDEIDPGEEFDDFEDLEDAQYLESEETQ